MPEWLLDIWAEKWAKAAVVAVGSFLIAWLVERVVLQLLARVTSRTETTVDDEVLQQLERPIYWSTLLVGFHWSIRLLELSERIQIYSKATFRTVALVLWSIALVRIARLILVHLAAREKEGAIVQTRTVPLFEVLLKTGLIAGSIYLAMVAWRIDVGAWLASAGVVGVAVGFAAQDSLANYFAGVFIIADAPYKLKDFVILEDGTRGRVIDMGLRSTRIHTRDGIEINIPNSVIGGMKVINASNGPSAAERVKVAIGVAYGSDMDHVIQVLTACTEGMENLAKKRPTEVAFTCFGGSSLDLEVRVWAKHPNYVDGVKHELHLRVYAALNEAGIEIPFPQQDLYVKEIPGSFGGGEREPVAA